MSRIPKKKFENLVLENLKIGRDLIIDKRNLDFCRIQIEKNFRIGSILGTCGNTFKMGVSSLELGSN